MINEGWRWSVRGCFQDRYEVRVMLELEQGISNPHTSNIKTFWTVYIKVDLSKSFPATRKLLNSLI